jgi:PPK2 family polyphosphate:nucleotide phosphotransferase
MADEPDEAAGVTAPWADDEWSEALRRAGKVRRALRVSKTAVDLGRIDTRGTPALPGRRPDRAAVWSRAEVRRLGVLIGHYQERLFAAAAGGSSRARLLLVLQGVDGSGKDATIRGVVGGMNPLGVRITAFRAPTPVEQSQNFLWRIGRELPPAGYVGVFNRSHYEDVLAVRVRGLVPDRVWRERFDHINAFESALSADGLTLVKVMLHLSFSEQRERLLSRLDDPTKTWKFDPSDVRDRALWPAYQAAYTDVLARCNTPQAPWYVVPADRRWYRNWAVANLLLAHLGELDPQYPPVRFDVGAERDRLLRD